MSDRQDEVQRLLKKVRRLLDDSDRERHDPDVRIIRVNKRTHRVRFEDETEDEVAIVIEKK